VSIFQVERTFPLACGAAGARAGILSFWATPVGFRLGRVGLFKVKSLQKGKNFRRQIFADKNQR
jgi:hypothetical protein